jgi:hypothetical protein
MGALLAVCAADVTPKDVPDNTFGSHIIVQVSGELKCPLQGPLKDAMQKVVDGFYQAPGCWNLSFNALAPMPTHFNMTATFGGNPPATQFVEMWQQHWSPKMNDWCNPKSLMILGPVDKAVVAAYEMAFGPKAAVGEALGGYRMHNQAIVTKDLPKSQYFQTTGFFMLKNDGVIEKLRTIAKSFKERSSSISVKGKNDKKEDVPGLIAQEMYLVTMPDGKKGGTIVQTFSDGEAFAQDAEKKILDPLNSDLHHVVFSASGNNTHPKLVGIMLFLAAIPGFLSAGHSCAVGFYKA